MTLAQLAAIAQAELDGAGDIEIDSVTDLAGAHPRALVMVAEPARVLAADDSPAGALLLGPGAPATRKPALRARNVRAAFARVLTAFTAPRPAAGIHPTAVVAADADLGADVTVGPSAVIESQAVIGAGSQVLAGVTIGARARVGAACTLHPGVTVYPGTVIGDRVIIHGGAVIGSDGFGYATEDGVHLKIPHVGRVVIEDDVEIGANTTIDRATLGETRIGRGTKIDNLVQIGHNVTVGAGTLIVAQVGISGSVTIGPGVVIAGQVGIADHRTIGAGAVVTGQAGVTKDVPEGATVSGFPAQDRRQELRLQASLRRVPDLIARVEALERRLAAPPAPRAAGRRRPRAR
jgi:UDP-3-O-[3-hydroxymyristoyl] glucosamine N-acyltransferase